MNKLLPIREAQEKILSAIKVSRTESCRVEHAYGRILAENIFSPLDLPSFDNSSIDGFTVYARDIVDASPTSPVHLPVKMDIPAGFALDAALTPGAAARILTGAPVPEGADAVVPIENTDQSPETQTAALPDSVAILKSARAGENIRRAGEDVQKGQLILTEGRNLQPQDIGMLISLGIRQVRVRRKMRIALFSSGNELLTPDQSISPGKIYDANRYVLTGILEAAGAEVIQLGIARDDPESVIATLDKALENPPDLVVSSAGVSVGVFDFVQQVIKKNGSLAFWKVNMRPGKPIAFGGYKGIPFLGLPGNPVSAYIGCIVFVLPCIRHSQGLPPFVQKTIKAFLTEPLYSQDGRESFYRGIIQREDGMYKASLTGHQGSGNLFSLVQANALLIVPAGVKLIPTGAEVTVWALDSDLNDQIK